MRWIEPVFVHWRADPSALVMRLPAGVVLDRFAGDAWLTLAVMATAGPAPAWLLRSRWSSLLMYLQVNLRTYVTGARGPGIVLLDTRVSRPWPALGARLAGRPYRLVDSRVLAAEAATVRGALLPDGETFTPFPRSLDSFLLDRFWVYGGRPHGIRVEHAPWRVRAAGLVGAMLPPPPGASTDSPVGAHLAESMDVDVVGFARLPPEERQNLASTPRFTAPTD